MFNERFNIKQRVKNIQIKKINIVLHNIRFWLHQLQNNYFIIHCDNQTICYNFIKKFIHDDVMMSLR